MPAGPHTDAILVNIILQGRLEELLAGWRAEKPPVKYDRIADMINGLIREQADRFGAETIEYVGAAPRRWAQDVYKIDGGRAR